MFEQSSHVPMIVRVPHQIPRRISDPINITDWFPTVCDYMRVPIPEGLDGTSLRPFIETGTSTGHQDFAFSEYNCHGIHYGMFMIRWKQYKYVYYCYEKPQLFDLDADPAEDHSLLDVPLPTPASMIAAEECHKRLLSVCNPYEVDLRARTFQQKTKQSLGIKTYDTDMADCPVPHPEALMKNTLAK